MESPGSDSTERPDDPEELDEFREGAQEKYPEGPEKDPDSGAAPEESQEPAPSDADNGHGPQQPSDAEVGARPEENEQATNSGELEEFRDEAANKYPEEEAS